MAQIIYEKNQGALIPTGDRSVSTFPSGLVKVEQNFICNTSSAEMHRAALAVGNDFPNGDYPAIDGLKIFPEVQEIRNNDGFTQFKVSAYGRTTNQFLNYKATINKQRFWNFGFTIEGGLTISGQSAEVDATYWKLNGKITIPKDESFSVESLGIPYQYLGIKGILYINQFPANSTTQLIKLGDGTYNYIDWNGDVATNKFITYRYFHGRDEGSGVDPTNAVLHQIIYNFPVIYLNSSTDFGNFVELDITIKGHVNDWRLTPADV